MIFLRFILLLTFGALLGGAARAEESFFQDRTVVVVAGLPGDLESEKKYSDEVVRLLNFFNSVKPPPKKVLLLDNLDLTFDFKTTYSLVTQPNDRKSFLALPEKLKDSAQPPLFIVFGHGGNLGDKPVFHIPGPRLTPEDFRTVAKDFPGSTWLLFFPGSGYFAKALQGANRTILATETDEKHFNQDPISFDLLLRLLNNETDLAKVADKLGAATEEWYQSRSIARTEEPALWVGDEPPRKLVVPADPAKAESAPVAKITVSEEAWPGITPAKAGDYSNADAVILSRQETYVIANDTHLTEEAETYIQILTAEGKRLGDFDFAYAPPDEDLVFEACEVRLPSGKIESLDIASIRNSAGSASADYSQGQRKIFSLPHVEPGAILHLHLKREWKRFPFPHVFEVIPILNDIPTRKLKIEVRVPEKTAFHTKLSQLPSIEPSTTKTPYGSVHTWQFHDLPAAPDEPLQPAQAMPTLTFTTFPDWAAFAAWYSGLIRESNQPTPEMIAEAKALAAGAKTDREKIAAVTRFVTNFRYVAIPLGVNSFRPHAAANVWANRYGDCKDKANLLNTLLGTLGFQANLVLVPRFTQADDDLPGFAFNHAISAVKLGDETLWLDSTDDVCRFGLLPPGDPGRKVLVIDGKTTALTTLPESKAADNRLAIDSKVTFSAWPNRVPTVEMNVTTTGYADYLLRSAAKALGRVKNIPLLEQTFETPSGEFQLSVQKLTTVSDLDQSFSAEATGIWPGLISRVPQSSTYLFQLPVWLPKEWRFASLPRATSLHLNQGYPMELSQAWKLQLPSGSTALKLPETRQGAGPVLTWTLSWTTVSPTEVTAKLELALLKADLTPEEARAFQTSCHDLQEALQDGLSFQNP